MSSRAWYILVAVVVVLALVYAFVPFGARQAPTTAPVAGPTTTETPPATTAPPAAGTGKSG